MLEPTEIVADTLHDAFKGDTDVDLDRLAVVIVNRLIMNERSPTYARSGRGSKPPYPGGRSPGSR